MRLAEALDDLIDGRPPVTSDRADRPRGWDSPGARPIDPDMVIDHVERAVAQDGLSLYEHQEEAIYEVLAGSHVIVTTPTGSGKSLIAAAAQFACVGGGGRTYYTAPIKALVSEKFFSLCQTFGAANVGMVTGDASVNADAPIICCTAEILANLALREGRHAAVDQVVMDEFHFIGDPDRGWAWQVPLSELPQAQMVIMSATLGDVSWLAETLTAATGRPSEVIGGAIRPVPLLYEWSMQSDHDTLETLVEDRKAPVYIVHPSQKQAVERAQSLTSMKLVSTEERHAITAELGGFQFSKGFGTTVRKFITAGIGVHHAGMLPKYRRLVESLAQRGMLKVICGTDTLGVGINVPIRTVMFTALTKFDGHRNRVLKSREFHQIAGRAGRAGFDTVGYVVAQAPEHVVANEKALAKAGDDPRKRRKVQRHKPPEGYVDYTEETFTRLIESTPETLHARMRVTDAMILNLLQRDEDTVAAVRHVIDAATSNPAERRRLYRRGVQIGMGLLRSQVIHRLPEPTPGGRRYAMNDELQDDFALNQPLSGFAAEAISTLDPASPTHTLDVVSVIEATLDNPMTVLLAQQHAARGERIAALKAEGYDYEERMEAVEEVEWPQPLAEHLEALFALFAPTHPWVGPDALAPKSIVRDMYERAMTFGEFCAFYKVQRSEGLVLRYLTDAYRALRQTVPEAERTEELEDLVAWLGQVVRSTDSSLIDEWEALTHPVEEEEQVRPARTFTSDERAFRVAVRNAMFRKVILAADDDFEALASLEPTGSAMTADVWEDALGDYWDEFDDLDDGPDARSPALFLIEKQRRLWTVRQIIDDPEGNHDWSILATVDLDECDEAQDLVLRTRAFARMD
ncbi:DEAD/DEAH box helicase [Acidipropionibacterium timonense]|uniref:DEAD/DEAH box helicase n=1 Tax=Acidipropionibacterium timonense TaxID=2161818 RepID=UPI00102FB585|nr:DEAD/DEAH box helicase [Acidipropionibacterium timonense]